MGIAVPYTAVETVVFAVVGKLYQPSYKNLIAIGLVCFLRCPLSKVINCLHIIRLKQHMQLLEGDIPAGRNFIYNFYYCCIFGHAFSCSLVCFIY